MRVRGVVDLLLTFHGDKLVEIRQQNTTAEWKLTCERIGNVFEAERIDHNPRLLVLLRHEQRDMSKCTAFSRAFLSVHEAKAAIVHRRKSDIDHLPCTSLIPLRGVLGCSSVYTSAEVRQTVWTHEKITKLTIVSKMLSKGESDSVRAIFRHSLSFLKNTLRYCCRNHCCYYCYYHHHSSHVYTTFTNNSTVSTTTATTSTTAATASITTATIATTNTNTTTTTNYDQLRPIPSYLHY